MTAEVHQHGYQQWREQVGDKAAFRYTSESRRLDPVYASTDQQHQSQPSSFSMPIGQLRIRPMVCPVELGSLPNVFMILV